MSSLDQISRQVRKDFVTLFAMSSQLLVSLMKSAATVGLNLLHKSQLTFTSDGESVTGFRRHIFPSQMGGQKLLSR